MLIFTLPLLPLDLDLRDASGIELVLQILTDVVILDDEVADLVHLAYQRESQS